MVLFKISLVPTVNLILYLGQYATHPDASGYHTDPNNPGWRGHPIPAVCGDRIATFMIYLSSVQLGGGTVFPAIGVTKDAKLVSKKA